MFIKIAEGLYIGAEPQEFIPNTIADITTILRINSEYVAPFCAVVLDYVLPSQELMDSELPKTMTKLTSISQEIQSLREEGGSVLICCPDGKNKCTLVAGFYLVTMGERFDTLIERLETVYFTDQEKAEEKAYQSFIRSRELIAVSNSEWQASENRRKVRQEKKCLSFPSYRKMLRMCGNNKK